VRFFPLVLKNVFRKKTRTLLTVGSIVLPLLVICVMATFLRALDRPDPAQTRGMFRLVVRHKVSLTSFLPLPYLEKIRQLDGVLAATNFTWFGGRYVDRSPKNLFARFAVEPESFLKVFDDATIVEGSAAEWLNDRTGALVGRNLMEKMGWKLGDRVVLQGDIFPTNVELTIKAVYVLVDGTSATCFFNRAYLDETFPWFKGQLGTVWLKARDHAAAERVPKQIDDMFENSPFPTKTESEKAFQMSFVAMMGNIKLLITSIATIIVAVILLIAANTMAMTARERITEIAVLRTLGFQKGTILWLIVAESLVIGVFGGVLGLVAFVLFEPGFKRGLMLSPMANLAATIQVYPDVLTLGFLVAVGVGLVAGIVPAIRSSQRSIVEGLRAT
jgi:putative ABC transport system permease protein